VFIAHEDDIRTFYVWSDSYSSDPFTYAILNTIAKMRIALSEVDPKVMELLRNNKVDVRAMEVEWIARLIKDGESDAKILKETSAPIETIKVIRAQSKVSDEAAETEAAEGASA
jgi:hypothetical protein